MQILQIGTCKVLWEGAYLSRADLSGADLGDANLLGANLSGADLSRADLSGADLSGANLSRANLSRAYLIRANLSGAYLSGANLIVGGQRSDGYRFLLYKDNGVAMVRAGCHYFTVKDAVEHWKTTRKDTLLGAESLALVTCLVAMAKAAGWKV